MRYVRYILSFALVLFLVFSFSAVATAQTAISSTDVQLFIRQLQEQITVLQTRITKLEKQLVSQSNELAEVKGELQLVRTLHRGVTGEDVKQLQEFLKRFPDIYPTGLVTGYYGSLTEEAVKRFQEKQDIVDAGSPETTGFGQVGPKTLSKLNELITTGAGASDIIPPGLLTAPGVAQKISDRTSTPLAVTSSTTAVASVPIVSATPVSGTTTPTVSVTPTTSVPSTSTTTTALWPNIRLTNFTGGGSYGEYPALASDGNGYGVVWEGSDGVIGAENIFFARLDAAGTVLGSPIRLTNHGYCGCVTANAPNIVWNGSRYAVSWVDNQVIVDNALGQVVRLVTLDTKGNKVTEIALSIPDDNAGSDRPYLKWAGANFAIGWQNWNASAKFYTEVGADGQTIAVYKKRPTAAEWSSVTSPAFSGSGSASGDRIYFSDAGKQEPVSTLNGSNTSPFITQGGSKYAIVWTNIQNNVSQIYFATKIPTLPPPPPITSASSGASSSGTATTTTTTTTTTTSTSSQSTATTTVTAASSSSSTTSTSSGSSSGGTSTTSSSATTTTSTATATSTSTTLPPSAQITVVAPAGGESLTVGSQYTIRWTVSAVIPSAHLVLNVLQNNVYVYQIADGFPNTGSYVWTVPGNYLGTGFKIYIAAYSDQYTWGYMPAMSNSFSIPTQITTPITVTSPNGGSTWDVYHYNQGISWTLNGVSRVGFKLLKGSQVVYSNSAPITTNSTTLSLYATFDGVASTYYNSIGGGSDYKIRVFDWDHPEVYDDSDNYFTIPLPDIMPPVVSSVSASGITSNSAVITWTTDEPATGQVNYGSTPLNWAVTQQDTSYTTSHSFTLSNLAANTPYTYRVYSLDAVSNGPQGFPPEHTFTTLSGPVSCSSINLTLNDGKTTYVKGVDNLVNYTWTCAPGGLADVNVGIQKPTGWISLNTTTNSSTQTLSIDISGASYPAGIYRLEACFNTCGSIVAGQTFTISSPSTSSLDLRTANLAAIYYTLESLKAIVEKLSKLLQ